jgi:arylsulfatase A-like enzyme
MALMNMEGRTKEEEYFVANVMRESVRWLEQNADKENKFLLVESWAPHELWFVPKHYRSMYYTGYSQQQVMSLYHDFPDLSPELWRITQANYSGLVTMCDRWFGYLYNSIANMGMLDDTLLVVTTDHGHSIGDNDYLGKRGYPSRPEVFKVPLFIRHPDDRFGRGKKSNILVQHTDIPATILDILGVTTKKGMRRLDLHGRLLEDADASYIREQDIEMDGKSFFGALINNEHKFRDHVTVGWGPNVTVITDDWWFNCRVNGKGPFLYDLQHDKSLSENVANAHPDILHKLFDLALKDAGGQFPDNLIEMANSGKDMPGCSDLAIG